MAKQVLINNNGVILDNGSGMIINEGVPSNKVIGMNSYGIDLGEDYHFELNDDNAYMTRIPDYKFYNNKNLKKINLSSPTYLAQRAFYQADNLEEVYLDNVTSFYNSGTQCYQFYMTANNMAKLRIVSLNGLTIIGSSSTDIKMFQNCYNLEEVYLENCEELGSYIFGTYTSGSNHCASLRKVYCPKLRIIGTAALARCSKLEEINLENVEEIKSYGMYGVASDKEKSFNFPKLKTIGGYAFQSNTYLKHIYLPNCETITAYAFQSAGSKLALTNPIIFDFRGATKIPTLANTTAFYQTINNKKIVVPDELYDEWKAAPNWSSTSYNIVTSIIKASDFVD